MSSLCFKRIYIACTSAFLSGGLSMWRGEGEGKVFAAVTETETETETDIN